GDTHESRISGRVVPYLVIIGVKIQRPGEIIVHSVRRHIHKGARRLVSIFRTIYLKSAVYHAEIACTFDPICLLPGTGDDGEQYGDEDCDDGYDDEEFDESESA